jgi:hypothetical protein
VIFDPTVKLDGEPCAPVHLFGEVEKLVCMCITSRSGARIHDPI